MLAAAPLRRARPADGGAWAAWLRLAALAYKTKPAFLRKRAYRILPAVTYSPTQCFPRRALLDARGCAARSAVPADGCAWAAWLRLAALAYKTKPAFFAKAGLQN